MHWYSWLYCKLLYINYYAECTYDLPANSVYCLL